MECYGLLDIPLWFMRYHFHISAEKMIFMHCEPSDHLAGYTGQNRQRSAALASAVS